MIDESTTVTLNDYCLEAEYQNNALNEETPSHLTLCKILFK